jgi:hypothetical protein
MAHSSPATRKRPSHSSRPSRGRNRPPQRARILATKLALLASALAFGSIATGAYFAFHDDVFAGLVGRQVEKQVPYEEQIADCERKSNAWAGSTRSGLNNRSKRYCSGTRR